jgi:uncharacterized protein YdhG (YjbR/CyaY superfamily)
LHSILRKVAPKAREVIKWGNPFFVEPRFLFAFTANKAHLNFTPTAAGLRPFRKELGKDEATKNSLRIFYDRPFPKVLVRKVAQSRFRDVSGRKGGTFW